MKILKNQKITKKRKDYVFKTPRKTKKRELKIFNNLKYVLIVTVGTCLFYLLVDRISDSEFFRIKEIKICWSEQCNSNGVYSNLTHKEVKKLAQISHGDSVIRLSPSVMKKRLLVNADLENAVIKRIFPDIVVITLYEKIPVAYMISGNRLYWVDKEGRKFKMFDSIPDSDFPVIMNCRMGEEMGCLKNAISYISLLETDKQNKNLSDISITDGGIVTNFIGDNFEVNFGNELSDNKITRYRTVRDYMHKRGIDAYYLDLSVTNKAIIKYRGRI